MKGVKVSNRLFLGVLASFSLSSISAAGIKHEISGNYNHNHHEDAVLSCFEIWKVIDIVRAIKSTPENRKHFCNELIDQVVMLYSDILRMNKHENAQISKRDLQFSLELFNNIRAHFFDAFYDVDSNEFFCITLMFDKIEQVFKQLSDNKLV